MEKNDNSFKNSEEISARKTQEKLTQLIKDIEDEDEDVRWNAVVELGKIKDVRAAEALTKVLLDKSLI
ncbi:MAG: HEAT repeat domain-containing protein [Candidatus Hodarchaeota archaeon]